MLKRKIVLFFVALVAMVVMSIPKQSYAIQRCGCVLNEAKGVTEPASSGNTCENGFYPQCTMNLKGAKNAGIENNGAVECMCKQKDTKTNEGNCSCNTGMAYSGNCQSGKVPVCAADGWGCECTTASSVVIVVKDVDVGTNKSTTGSSYDPFAGCTSSSINTAFGCVPVEMEKFVPWLLTWLFGVAGGIAFLLMVYGFILIATSAGDEKKVQGARETITSAVVGLLVCVFSIFILRLIAVNILQIPGMS